MCLPLLPFGSTAYNNVMAVGILIVITLLGFAFYCAENGHTVERYIILGLVSLISLLLIAVGFGIVL